MKMSYLLELGNNKDILDQIRRNRQNIVPFIGAGVSAAYGYPTWKELLEELAVDYLKPDERENLDDDAVNLLDYAQKIVSYAGKFNIVVENMRGIYNKCSKKKSEIGYILVKSFSNNIVTTNYDTVLENAIKNTNDKSMLVLLPDQREKMTEAIKKNLSSILKMHGSIDEASSIIFSSSQYENAYGTEKVDMQKAIPWFLSCIFNGKSVLFIGCSLSQDRTMEVLSACLDKNEYIKNYAIVGQPIDENKKVEQNRQLSALGIVPIYYPEGDYECVELLINYLAGENPFIQIVKEELSKYVDKLDIQYDLMCSIMNETYYKTAAEYPEILNYDVGKDTFIRNLEIQLKKLHPDQSIYEICLHILDMFADTCVIMSDSIRENLRINFINAVLRETDIEEYMRKTHSVYSIPPIHIETSSQEITRQADFLNRKIQYENDRDYSDYYIYYNQSVELLDSVYENIEIRQRILLCNSVGAGYSFLKEPQKAIKYLEKAIDELLTMEDPSYHILAMCYCNMSIIQAKAMEDYQKAIDYVKQDLKIKRLLNENERLVANSLGLLALYETEMNPFSSIQRHMEVIGLKRNNINIINGLRYERDKLVSGEQMRKKIILSWATSVFNFSLLIKDLGLHEEAKKFMDLANKYRYEYCPQNSFDYCASLNSEMEINILLGKEDIQKGADALQKRIAMNKELNNTLFHSYYVCALYFYYIKDYDNAMKYISRYKFEYRINNVSRDIRLEAKVAKLIMKIYILKNKTEKAKEIYDEIIKKMIPIYGEDSVWLLSLKEVYGKIESLEKTDIEKQQCFSDKLTDVAKQLNDFYLEMLNDLPLMLDAR